MEANPTLNCYSATEYAEISAKLEDDFIGKLKVKDESSDNLVEEKHPELHDDGDEEEGSDEDDDDDDYEFSFFCTDPDGSPISAEEIFQNGQIRPIFPLFNRDLLFAGGNDGDLKSSNNDSSSSLRPPMVKYFVEEHASTSSADTDDVDEVALGEFCAWSGKAVEASPDVCKKSNSTGFSRLRRFRDLLHRSHSDGKDAFVFLDPTERIRKMNQANESKIEKTEKVEKSVKVSTESKSSGEAKVAGKKGKGGKGKKALSAHEMHYLRNRELKVGDRRKSYLPYRQDLVGFFTNVNGLSRNVHPF